MTLAKSRPRGETLFPTPAPRCCLCSCCCPSAPTPCTGSSLWRAWGSVLGTLPGVQAWLPPLRAWALGSLCPACAWLRGPSAPSRWDQRPESGAGPAPTMQKLHAPPLFPSTSLPLKMVLTGPHGQGQQRLRPPTPGLAPVPHSLNLRTPLPSPELGREGSHTVVADLLPRRLALAVPACTASRVRLAAPAAPAATLLADLSLSLFLPAPPLCAP